MKLNPLLVLPCLSISTAMAGEILPYTDPGNDGGWKLNEKVSDEFEGDALDMEKWLNLGLDGNYHGEWKGRAPSQFNPANVSLRDGKLVIASRWDPGFEFSDSKFNNGFHYGKPAPVTTGSIISRHKFKYGYMEMRCKAADGPVSSSFWSTGPGGEIDVFEHFGANPEKPHSEKRFHTSFHDWRKGSQTFGKRIWTNDHMLDFRVADDFHIYGLEWAEDFLKIFVDGRLVNCVTKDELGDKWVATSEQKIWIDCETFDWEIKPSALKESDFDENVEFIVDYCRIWQREGEASGCEERENLVSNESFEKGMDSWSGAAEIVSGKSRAGDSSALLKKDARIEQTIKVRPNTTYMLSAWVASPAENQANVWIAGRLGANGFGKDESSTTFIFPYYQEKSLQIKTGQDTETISVFFENKSKNGSVIVDQITLTEAPDLSAK
ncbi:family 16 glycosylhydrolase [Luteolibacter algae]|uniref:Family 16 glycosylhydrolase n=1 Tax=Luteolibacter algae TaxID=454151 RepID=A0ABW5D9M5_9BACT